LACRPCTTSRHTGLGESDHAIVASLLPNREARMRAGEGSSRLPLRAQARSVPSAAVPPPPLPRLC
jgi:hypothetical protein